MLANNLHYWCPTTTLSKLSTGQGGEILRSLGPSDWILDDVASGASKPNKPHTIE